MSDTASSLSSASVRNILTLLASRDAQLVGGIHGLERRVTWSCRMRARLPAFESIRGGELALLTLAQLQRLEETLPRLLKSLHDEGVAAVAVAAPTLESLDRETRAVADQLRLPLIWLPVKAQLEEIEREIITFVVSFRGEIERQATEISHALMELSMQGVGMQGMCEFLARSCKKWVIVEYLDHTIRLQAPPANSEALALPAVLSGDNLTWRGLRQVTLPILVRSEAVGYLALIGKESDFDTFERLVLGQVAPILALEFAREKERGEVEGRYQFEALLDVLQGNYQQADEMLARAHVLGHDLTTPQVVAVLELTLPERELTGGMHRAQWGKRLRNEIERLWPASWVMEETQRLTFILPLPAPDNAQEESDHVAQARLERACKRLQAGKQPHIAIAGGVGRLAQRLQDIPRSWREAQQALEIGKHIFGGDGLYFFAQLGIYRLLFLLESHEELTSFCQETLGPLLSASSRDENVLIETLEGYFHCNGNLSETARAMHLHRNSLLYRLGRIEEILGRSLDDAEYRLSLQIALKIHAMRRK